MSLINRFCCFFNEYLFQNMKQKLLWEADVSELIQELLKRKSDRGESYFQLEVTQYENQKQRKNFIFLCHIHEDR